MIGYFVISGIETSGYAMIVLFILSFTPEQN
jgi:hypothetical protein